MISIRRFSLASIPLIFSYSATLYIKYSPPTIVLDLNRLFMLRFFRCEVSRKHKMFPESPKALTELSAYYLAYYIISISFSLTIS